MAYKYGQTMGIPVGASCAPLIEGLCTVVLSVYLLFLPNDAVDWSLVCDCGILWSYSLTFLLYPPPQTLFVVGILFSRCPCIRPYIRPSVHL